MDQAVETPVNGTGVKTVKLQKIMVLHKNIICLAVK